MPVLRRDQSGEVGVAVALDRDGGTGFADSVHVGGDAAAMLGAIERSGLERGALGSGAWAARSVEVAWPEAMPMAWVRCGQRAGWSEGW